MMAILYVTYTQIALKEKLIRKNVKQKGGEGLNHYLYVTKYSNASKYRFLDKGVKNYGNRNC